VCEGDGESDKDGEAESEGDSESDTDGEAVPVGVELGACGSQNQLVREAAPLSAYSG
jgi:hypothetical protein